MNADSPSRLREGGNDRAALVAFARDSIARGSKSFDAASRLFDPVTRERAWLLYSWCRACDDLADGQVMGHGMSEVADPMARLAVIRINTEAALRGERTGEPAFDALGHVVAECGIPRALPRDLVRGFALDAAGFGPRTEADLMRYCYHVAGSVGCMMAIIMGVDPRDADTLDRACDLGIAFQLANIARDLSEDDAAGRCYLPINWLVEIDVPPGEHLRPYYRSGLAFLAKRMADRAASYEASARVGARALPFRARWAVLAAAGIYGDIMREVAARGTRAWDKRVVTTKGEKLGWIARAFGQALIGDRHGDRNGLWTRPQDILDDRETVSAELAALLHESEGLALPVPLTFPLDRLGIVEGDYAALVDRIEKQFAVDLTPILLTGEFDDRARAPIARNLSIDQIARHIVATRAQAQA